MKTEKEKLDFEQIFANLSDDKKIEFLKELQEIMNLEDQQSAEVQRILAETIQEFEAKKAA